MRANFDNHWVFLILFEIDVCIFVLICVQILSSNTMTEKAKKQCRQGLGMLHTCQFLQISHSFRGRQWYLRILLYYSIVQFIIGLSILRCTSSLCPGKNDPQDDTVSPDHLVAGWSVQALFSEALLVFVSGT